MGELAAYSTVAVTLGLVLVRPTVASFRITPAMAAFAGVALMAMLGLVRAGHVAEAVTNLWPPFVAIASVMIMTDVARRSGLLAWWAAAIEMRATSTKHLFLLVFGLGVVTSTVFNNDAAILLLTPIVLTIVKRRYPLRPELLPAFAFAVFMSAGVAALPVSNPMNMVVAGYLHIGFGEYVLQMLPVAAAGWLIAYAVLRRVFARALEAPFERDAQPRVEPTALHRRLMIVLLAVLALYPLLAMLGVPVWPVALGGAVVSTLLARHHLRFSVGEAALRGVSWDTLAFLLAVLVMSLGLRDVGLVERIAHVYRGASIATIGVLSATGSAVLNNHPMSQLNMLALASASTPSKAVFAALVGGDLGPRLLPMGSLAGLLWLEMLRRHEVRVSVGRFVWVGVLVAAPTIAVSLAILSVR